MDPSTQRMLERARARREKLAEQLKTAGQEAILKRTPLQENNSQFVKVTTEVEVVLNSPDHVEKVNVSPTKVQVCGVNQTDDRLPKPECTIPFETVGVENNHERNIRSRLKRLGVLYSDGQLSSPIHRTESQFTVESDQVKTNKTSTRVARLAALADDIKQWEDDLSHPGMGMKLEGHANPDKHRSHNADASNIVVEHESSPKKTAVRHNQESNKDATFKTEASRKSKSDAMHSKVDIAVNPQKSSKSDGSHLNTNASYSLCKDEGISECVEKNPVKIEGSPNKIGRAMGSPRKVNDSPKAGSVLHKASLFESCSPTKKVKDPTELPVSERMALFERNKGQALIPKAAFSMPVPSKYLENIETKKSEAACSPEKLKMPEKPNPSYRVQNLQISLKSTQEKSRENAVDKFSNKVLLCKNIFEHTSSENASVNIQDEQTERKKDLEMLKNRWNKNKNLASDLDKNHVKNDDKVVPIPPPLPDNLCPTQDTFSALPQVTQMIPKSLPNKMVDIQRETSHLPPVEDDSRRNESPKKLPDYSDICKVKKIRVSPPKPGKLYPCLSDIEVTTTEAESEAPEESEREFRETESESSIATDTDDGNTSFGREILEAAGIRKTSLQGSKMDSSNSDFSESAVLADIDCCIDEALKGYDSSSDSDNGGPTPPKRTRDYSRSPPKGRRNSRQSPNSKPSQSFRYTPGCRSTNSSPEKSSLRTPGANVPIQIVEGDNEMPLMHSVSFYRRQQNLAVKNTPVRQIVRPPEMSVEIPEEHSVVNEEEEVGKKISTLLEEVSKQQTVIFQASQALNLCLSTVEFSGSAEQVEGERLLLLASQKRQAALHEIQRLKVEGTLKPLTESGRNHSFDKGSLLLTNIALILKKDYVRKLSSEENCYHFVCLVKSQEQVLVTQVIAATPQNLKENCNLVWNSPLRLIDLFSDFKVTLEVYSLQTRKEMLPHNVKYHIGNKKETGKSWLTPKKQKQDSRLVMPAVHSPAGPSAVRSSEFRMAGYVVFSLRELSRTHFTLNKVSYSSPLEGNIQLQMKSELSVDVNERGFLTMFEDVSGFGAWHRRWFVLKGSILAYWKYPDDEKKVPIGHIDLNLCTTELVGLVSRDICARPNTFLLETGRPVMPDDRESLVVVTCKDRTIIRNLLSADTKEERLLWCNQLNKALSMLRAWGKKQD